MADDTILNAGTGGDTFRSVEKDKPGGGKRKTPVCLIDVGGAGAESLVTAANAAAPIPVRLTDGTNFYVASAGGGGTVEVSNFPATQAVSAAALPLPAGAATEATLAALSAKLAAGNPIGNVGLVPVTSGGLSVAHLVSAASTNATSAKSSAGQLYGYMAFNTHQTSYRYLKVYDKATAPDPAADAPILSIGIPPQGGANLALPNGVQFVTGIAFAVVTGIADNDATPTGAGEVLVNLTYK